MIEYKSKYEAGQEPHVCKLITASNGEEFCTEINLSNKNELDNISDEEINEHIQNLIQYLQHLASQLQLHPEPEIWDKPYPFKNLKEIIETYQNMLAWWGHLNYAENESRSLVMSEFDHNAMHENDEPHEHDPITDEPIYGLGVRGEFGS